jgi:ATP-binding cassette subfamily B protein
MIYEILDVRPHQGDQPGAGALVVRAGEVRFEDVSFSYAEDLAVLRGVTFTAQAGRTTAIVGGSGAGKSTLVALLQRFYDVGGGTILIDGQDISAITKASLRRRIAYVSQQPYLFEGTIADNIRYGREDATDEEVRAAASAANAAIFIEEFPDAYDTLVGERGVRLSGGQKQRIAIARAVLKDPRVLILDEATSALDAESEHLVREALERLMAGRSTLVIAHRLSTVRNAHRVVVLDGGRAVETGSHDELMAKGGLYRRLVERQFSEAA